MVDVIWQHAFPTWVIDRVQSRLGFVRPFATCGVVVRAHLRSSTSRNFVRGVANLPDTALYATYHPVRDALK